MGDRNSFCPENEDRILRIEAEAAVREVAFAVTEVEVSKALPNTDECVYMNLKTKESATFCVELSVQGFRIVGRSYDVTDDAQTSSFFETIYALLDDVSPKYRQSFGDALMKKLSMLQGDAGQQ